MNILKVALCQMKVVDNKQKNIEKAIQMIKDAKKQGAELAILPEMFNCPYENEKFIEYGEILNQSETLNKIAKIAKEENIHIIAGSIPEIEINPQKKPKEKNLQSKSLQSTSLYNTSVYFDNTGTILGKHRKIHLFDIDIEGKICFKESNTLTAGNNITVIETKFAKIGIGICYDIRFVELSRLMALKGAQILIFPGAFNLTTGPAHWELLFKSRALDNQVYTIGVAPALDKNASYNSYGHSIVANPWGEIIGELDYDELLKVVEIDLDEIEKVREEIPILKNRRTDLYNINLK